ncbi:hypothetical protein [Massilia sp. TSP1-1-2]|uniref:hypothetical protein n=1 Tax=unclassified Massilia TaxID=2609279 RepID=UPI003CE9689C
MTSSFLRPAILIALAAASLAACGGKATFDITGQISNLRYDSLVLVETVSGQTVTVGKNATTFAFPNTIEYGAQFKVAVRETPSGQPPHQTCTPNFLATGTAGQRASITMGIVCTDNPHTVTGSITASGTGASYVGLKLINGSNDLAPFTVTDAVAQTAYSYPNITYGTSYGITILQQPTDLVTMCKLVPKVATPGALPTMVAGDMGDVDIVIDVVCAKP